MTFVLAGCVLLLALFVGVVLDGLGITGQSRAERGDNDPDVA